MLASLAVSHWLTQANLTSLEVGQDLRQIEAMLEEVHPNPFFKLSQADFRRRAQKIQSLAQKGMDRKRFFVESAKLVALLGDGHTRISPVTPEYLKYREGGGLLFPLEFAFQGSKAIVSKNYLGGSPIPGTEIKKIQGMDANSVRSLFVSMQSGERMVFREQEAGRNVRAFAFSLFKWEAPFRIESVGGQKFELPGVPFSTILQDGAATPASPNLPGCAFRILPNKIGYLEFTSGNDPERFKSFVSDAFINFKQADIRGLVIDVRRNPGGGSEAGAMVIESFTDKPYRQFGGSDVKISQMMKDKYGEQEYGMRFGTQNWLAKAGTIQSSQTENTVPEPNPIRFSGPVFVLIGTGTFSNGMAFASAVKDLRLATLVGEETGGMGCGYGQFEPFELKNSGLTLWVSVKRIFRPSRVDDGKGILPDVPVRETAGDIKAGRDVVLDKAIQLCQAQTGNLRKKN